MGRKPKVVVAPEVEEVVVVEAVEASSHDNVVQHLDCDPNDPRVKH
jgi:hypothetical protein